MGLISLSEFDAIVSTASSYSTAAKTAFINAASTAVEKYCRRTFNYETRTEDYTGENHPDLRLNLYPIDTTSTITVNVDRNRTFAAATDLESTDFDVFGESGILRLRSARVDWYLLGYAGGASRWGYGGLVGGAMIAWPNYPNGIRVTYSGGYVSIPDDLKIAVANVAIFGLRSIDFGGMTSTSENYIDVSSGGLSFLTESLARGQLPAIGSTRAILDSYRKHDLPVSTLIR